MLWRLNLAMAVVFVSGMCNCGGDDMMSRLILPRDYGVKLCGREFIRAVIFTCGGSRWKRSTEADLDPFQWKSLSDVTAEDSHETRQLGTELTPDDHSPLRSSYSLADLVALLGARRHSLTDPEMPEKSRPSTVLNVQEGYQVDLPTSSRRKRNFSLGVAGKCCNQGCTKNDIGRLC